MRIFDVSMGGRGRNTAPQGFGTEREIVCHHTDPTIPESCPFDTVAIVPHTVSCTNHRATFALSTNGGRRGTAASAANTAAAPAASTSDLTMCFYTCSPPRTAWTVEVASTHTWLSLPEECDCLLLVYYYITILIIIIIIIYSYSYHIII